MELSGVLFDLDGTLADTGSAEREAWDEIADVIERHVPTVDRSELCGRYASAFSTHWAAFLDGRLEFGEYRRRRLAEAIAPWGEVDDALFDAYRSEKRRSVERLRAFEDAVPTIRRIRRSGLRVGLLTNGPSEFQRAKLRVTGLESALDAVAISEEIGAAKPSPEAFQVAVALLGCDRADVVMVGDSPLYDVNGALGAGLAGAVLVCPDVDVAAESSIVVRTLSEVPGALGLG